MFNNLPKNWKSKKLEQLLTYYIGGEWGEEELISDEYAPVKIIKATDLTNWESDNGKNAQIRYLKKSSIQKRELKDLDILLEISGGSKDQPVGRTVIIKKEQMNKNTYSCSNFFRLLRIDQKELSPEYLNYYFKFLYQTKIIEKYQSNSTNLRNLKFKQFINQQITYPLSEEEQKEIVNILDAISIIIKLRKECIQHAQDIIPVLFQEMFKKYEKNTVSLSNICDIKGGKRLPQGEKLIEEKTSHPYIRVMNFKNQSVDLSDIKYITDDVFQKISRYVITTNDIYISIAGTIGLVGEIPIELNNANLTENAAKLILNNKNVNKKFLIYCLNSPYLQQQIKEVTVGVGVPKLALTRIGALKIYLPPIELQEQFSQKAIEIENYIQEQQEEFENAQQMFQFLLHHAFSGELTQKKYGGGK